ncbi:MAG TPA: class II aldolase/adducin family protein [Ignavibacteria bacterium]|nr:class II aldolase/adducin family protein [Ignavibacteria bacterium]HMR41495.1 class II aldolase/adducin family protein [Ignavibacteria bacterium]
MKFSIEKNDQDTFKESIAEALTDACIRNGDELVDTTNEANYILNFTTFKNPKSVRRQSRSLFVITFICGDTADKDEDKIKSMSYNALVKSLSNLLIYISPGLETFFTTPEAGFYQIFFNPDEIYEKIKPIISSSFATDNVFIEDLPERLWSGTDITGKIRHYGKVLDKIGVLPVPFRLKGFLTESELRHLYKIYGITGASYGNLSARERIPELGKDTFWMTGRGVDKSNLVAIGKDILLVKDFDYENREAILSMPSNYNPKARVSVDAVEHSMIYKTYPEIGAIVHVHAWIQGVLCTRQNYPCGTIELAQEVIELLGRSKDPVSTAVGLKNHGLTITGRDLDEIFEKFSGSLVKEVEMFA